MKTIIVGGSPEKKVSSVVNKIAEEFSNPKVFNGTEMPSIKNNDLILWMPDVDNAEEKTYPVKDIGSVLICSKVMRKGYTFMDAVARIFKMHGNAVIAINKEPNKFRFTLIDALGHIWCSTYDIKELCYYIIKLYSWTKCAIRKSIPKTDEQFNMKYDINDFIEINKELAYKSAAECGNRYFGNFSTRCTKLFPSYRNDDVIFMSPRNVDKRTLTSNDMIPIINGKYTGTRKPSVDAPVQLEIYKNFDHINYMIHGHSFIRNAHYTEHYYPCGDMREISDIFKFLEKGFNVINLKHHGFLICTETIQKMNEFKNHLSFEKIYEW